MRPELFGGIYAEVPFVDVLNTLLDRSLPLTELSFSEFGNPIDSKADFLNLQSYSPYDNVRAQAYPPMLVLPAASTTRACPIGRRPSGWRSCAQLKTDSNPIILLVNMRGGHGGGSGRFDTLEEFARAYAFGMKVVKR